MTLNNVLGLQFSFFLKIYLESQKSNINYYKKIWSQQLIFKFTAKLLRCPHSPILFSLFVKKKIWSNPLLKNNINRKPYFKMIFSKQIVQWHFSQFPMHYFVIFCWSNLLQLSSSGYIWFDRGSGEWMEMWREKLNSFVW